MKVAHAGTSGAQPIGRRRDDTSEKKQVDIVALGIVFAAILLFVGTGSEVGPAVVASLAGNGSGPDHLILNAFLLNIAIILFGWSRYRDLQKELRKSTRAEREARRLADTDTLTGYFNRRTFNEHVNVLIDDAIARSQSAAIMMIDLDNFKTVNDYHGHATGDELLCTLARRIGEVLPEPALIGRIGGDEFAVALAFDPGRAETIDTLAGRIVSAVSDAVPLDTINVEVTASIGLARSDVSHSGSLRPDARKLLEMADIAMYHAKRNGRNSFHWFDPHMADEMRFRSELEYGIRQGIPRGEFIPFYEQQIDLQTGELTGFEMLARWDSPTLGIIPPDVFIPIAEDIGVIADLSESVIGQALEDAKSWDPGLSLSVNISPLQLRDPWFAQKLLRLLLEANFPPQRLEIEITESCLHENLPQVRSLISSLKNQGIKVSLDDFGTGYSSLAQLRSLPFDRIKIDRSFVTSLIHDSDSAAIVEAITMLGKGLELPITAEGIENGEVMHELLKYGDIKGQGYFYGRPRPASDLAEWLEAYKHGRTTNPLPPVASLTDASREARPAGVDEAAFPAAETRRSA